MSTPQDGLANIVAYVSMNIAGGAVTRVDSFQVGPVTLVAADLAAGTAGIFRVGAGIIDIAIDIGKGMGPNTLIGALEGEFSLATTGTVVGGTVPMMWTVTETAASTANIRIYRFQFFNATVAAGSVVTAADPVQTCITIRRKKPLPGSV